MGCGSEVENNLKYKNFENVFEYNNSTLVQNIYFSSDTLAIISITDLYGEIIDFYDIISIDSAGYEIDESGIHFYPKVIPDFKLDIIDSITLKGITPNIIDEKQIFKLTTLNFFKRDSIKEAQKIIWEQLDFNFNDTIDESLIFKEFKGILTCEIKHGESIGYSSYEEHIIKNQEDFDFFKSRIQLKHPDGTVFNDSLINQKIDFKKYMLVIFVRNDGLQGDIKFKHLILNHNPAIIISEYMKLPKNTSPDFKSTFGIYKAYLIERIDRTFVFYSLH